MDLRTGQLNELGYGYTNKFVPPLQNSTWLLSEFDKYILLITSNPLIYWFQPQMLKYTLSLDAFDLFWYNNAAAVGDQAYPSGLNKYFDMYSYQGLVVYSLQYLQAMFYFFLSPFTLLVPASIWYGAFSGDKSLDKIQVLLIPLPVIWAFGITGEAGYQLL